METSIGDLTLQTAYEQTAKRVLGPHPTGQELAAYRRAFFTGARAMHGLMLIAGTHLPGKAEAAMESLEKELRDFDRSAANPFLAG